MAAAAAAAAVAANPSHVFMTRGDFEAVKHDPMLVLERATQTVVLLEQLDRAYTEENRLLQQQLRQETERAFTAEQHAMLVENAAELELDHRELSQRYVDVETSNGFMQGVVEALRRDKQELIEETAFLREEQTTLVSRHSHLIAEIREKEDALSLKQAHVKKQQDEIDIKNAALEQQSHELMELTQRAIELQNTAERVGSGRLALEVESTALEQATQQQERTLAYLQSEVTTLEQLIRSRADEMVQLKKNMSAAVLELQLTITKCEEEMSRLRTTVANEKDLTGRQNLWLAKDLSTKTQELLLTRQELTRENAELKSELAQLRDKAARLRGNVLVMERRNRILHDDLKRLEEEDRWAKDEYLKRKEETQQEMAEQSSTLGKLNAQLQTAREDLYVAKSKMCKSCRRNILADGEGTTNRGQITSGF